MSDDKLRAIYSARLAKDAPADRAGCLSPEQLQTLAEGARGGEPNLAGLDHVFSCAHCRAEFALLRAVQNSAESSETPSAAVAKANQRWFSAQRLATAAGVLVAVGLFGKSFWDGVSDSFNEPVRNATDSSDVVIVGPTANGASSAESPFVWRAVIGASTYELQVLDTTGALLATQITSDTSLALNAADRAKIESAKVVDWFVSAKRADGNERRSAVVRVRF